MSEARHVTAGCVRFPSLRLPVTAARIPESSPLRPGRYRFGDAPVRQATGALVAPLFGAPVLGKCGGQSRGVVARSRRTRRRGRLATLGVRCRRCVVRRAVRATGGGHRVLLCDVGRIALRFRRRTHHRRRGLPRPTAIPRRCAVDSPRGRTHEDCRAAYRVARRRMDRERGRRYRRGGKDVPLDRSRMVRFGEVNAAAFPGERASRGVTIQPISREPSGDCSTSERPT